MEIHKEAKLHHIRDHKEAAFTIHVEGWNGLEGQRLLSHKENANFY